MNFVPWLSPVVTHPIDTPKVAYGWVYYLLGAHNEQLAVYHGQQDTGNVCGDTVSGVSMYPSEYLTYGVAHNASVMTNPSGVKEYRIGDHLGSVRSVVGGSSIQGRDYEPYGDVLGSVTPGLRKGYIDREVDKETGLGNYGVRAMESKGGGFLTIDPLWEKFRGWSPYAYANNDPIGKSDPMGEEAAGGNQTNGIGGGRNEMNPQDYYDFTAPEEGGGVKGGGGGLGSAAARESMAQQIGAMRAAESRNARSAAMSSARAHEQMTRNSASNRRDLPGKIIFNPKAPEKVATQDFNQAMNVALEWLERKGFVPGRITLGKFGSSQGKPVGMQTADGKAGFRVEYDERSGAHINAWSGKDKSPHFKFEASKATVEKITKRYGR